MNHFTIEEFQCPCCEHEEMDYTTLRMLDEARDLAEVPFKITSGYRCGQHNIAVGGESNSAHTRGYAADIAIPDSETRYKVLLALAAVGFGRIGIAGTFIHCDNDNTLPDEVVWTY